MKNYVISLTTATDRRTHIINEFGRQNVPFVFFDAIIPTQVNALAEKFNVNITDANLTSGELACLFSHICLWQQAIDENLDYIVIFEDDVYLGENADQFLTQSDWIPTQCNIIKLEMFEQYIKMAYHPIMQYQNRCLRQLKQIHLGAAGYILSQQMCIDLMQFIRHYPQGIVASDHILFEDYLYEKQAIYQLVPALCVQSDRVTHKTNPILHSVLEPTRRERINKSITKPSIPKKIIREFKRLFHDAYTFFPKMLIKMFCKIDFK